jgi:hypothetical protein
LVALVGEDDDGNGQARNRDKRGGEQRSPR